jgi:hypothetical protein
MKQMSLDLGRCEVVSKQGWRCTKWAGKHHEHTALAPSGWDPDYAVTLTGRPNIPVRAGLTPYEARLLSEVRHDG